MLWYAKDVKYDFQSSFDNCTPCSFNRRRKENNYSFMWLPTLLTELTVSSTLMQIKVS